MKSLILHKRRLWLILLILIGGMGWIGYRAAHRSLINHELIQASAAGNPGWVRTLLERGADPNAMEDSTLQTNWERVVNLFRPSRHPRFSICPLSQALASGASDAAHVEIVRLLLEHQANPNLKLGENQPMPLRAVTVGEGDDIPALFLQHGADPNTVDTDVISHSPLLLYAVNDHRWKVAQLLLEHGAKPDLANADGDSALMWAAYQQDLTMLKILLEHGADVHHQNGKGRTALNYALAHKSPMQRRIVEALLAAGADGNAPDSQGCTPFQFALLQQNSTADSLLAYGGDVNRPIPLSMPRQELEVLMRLEGYAGAANMTHSATPGATPLMLVALSHNADLLRKLLGKGANARAKDSKGKTALDYAAGDPQMQRVLQLAAAHP